MAKIVEYSANDIVVFGYEDPSTELIKKSLVMGRGRSNLRDSIDGDFTYEGMIVFDLRDCRVYRIPITPPPEIVWTHYSAPVYKPATVGAATVAVKDVLMYLIENFRMDLIEFFEYVTEQSISEYIS